MKKQNDILQSGLTAGMTLALLPLLVCAKMVTGQRPSSGTQPATEEREVIHNQRKRYKVTSDGKSFHSEVIVFGDTPIDALENECNYRRRMGQKAIYMCITESDE